MSWHDSARTLEPDADSALREELRGLLGVRPRTSYFETEPSPELMLLADDLRREAKRRNHTARKQHSWMLMAAALPVALALGGISTWGMQQKHRADAFASAVQRQETELQRMAATLLKVQGAAPSQALAPETLQLASSAKPKPKRRGKELIIPVERSAEPLANDTQQVKGH
jgi:hypothetical protein